MRCGGVGRAGPVGLRAARWACHRPGPAARWRDPAPAGRRLGRVRRSGRGLRAGSGAGRRAAGHGRGGRRGRTAARGCRGGARAAIRRARGGRAAGAGAGRAFGYGGVRSLGRGEERRVDGGAAKQGADEQDDVGDGRYHQQVPPAAHPALSAPRRIHEYRGRCGGRGRRLRRRSGCTHITEEELHRVLFRGTEWWVHAWWPLGIGRRDVGCRGRVVVAVGRATHALQRWSRRRCHSQGRTVLFRTMPTGMTRSASWCTGTGGSVRVDRQYSDTSYGARARAGGARPASLTRCQDRFRFGAGDPGRTGTVRAEKLAGT